MPESQQREVTLQHSATFLYITMVQPLLGPQSLPVESQARHSGFSHGLTVAWS